MTIYVHPALGNTYRQTGWTANGRVILVECDERGELVAADCCQIVEPKALRQWPHYHLVGAP
jgi:hypothetical protein